MSGRMLLTSPRRSRPGARAPRGYVHDVPRDGHDLLAGEGRRGAGAAPLL